MRKSIILAVVLMVALVAVPASASVQNVKVSGSIDSTYLFRDNFDLGANLLGDEQQSLFITQTTLQVDADLTDQVSATVGLINEREWDQSPAGADTDISLYLAYVTLREMLYSPLTVVAGRQVFSYGNSLVIDATGPNTAANGDSALGAIAGDLTKQSSTDAIRLIFDYNPLTMELLYAKIESTLNVHTPDPYDDVDLYGINTTYELGDDMNTQVEAYFFSRIDKSRSSPGAGTLEANSKSDTVYMPGLRASMDVLDGLNIQGEVAWQRGNRIAATTSIGAAACATTAVCTSAAELQNEQRDAVAAQFISNYQIPNDVLPDGLEEYNPVLGYVYTYVSGDSNPNDRTGPDGAGAGPAASANRHTAWDPMFENQGGGTIYNSLFSLSNLHIHSVSLTANPMEDVTSKVTWSGLWLDKKINNTLPQNGTLALLQPDGTATGTLLTAANEKDLGHEIDFETTYDYTEDVQFGANLGWFMPGDVFRGDREGTAPANGNDKIASQVIIHGNVNF